MRWKILAILVTLIGGWVVWVSLVAEPQPAAGDHLDLSWKESYGYFLKNNLQAGRDYIFPCGPLGHFYSPVYDSDLFWLDYFVELSLKSWLAFVFLRFALRIPSLLARLVYCAAIGVPILFIGYMPDSVWVLAITLSLVTNLRINDTFAVRDVVPLSATIGIVSLMKFTLFVMGMVAMTILVVNMIIRQSARMLLLLVLGSVATFLFAWFICGQSLGNLPTYFVQAIEIARGYSEAMSFEDHSDRPYLLLAIVATSLFAFVWIPASRSERREWMTLRFWSIATAIAAAIGLSWKHAFVRADVFHTPGFFWLLLPLVFLIPVLLPAYDWRSPLRVGALSGCGFLSLFGFLGIAIKNEGVSLTHSVPRNFLGHLGYVFLPRERKRILETNRQELAAQFALTKIKEKVGNETVDIFPYHQGVLFLNDLNWRPRPVFHSYSAYTPKLLDLNADFFRSSRAPRYVILKLQTIDNRFPMADDGLALIELLRQYRPLFEEHSYLLMERNLVAAKASPSRMVERTVRFDEPIALNTQPTSYQTMGLEVELSTSGKLQMLLYQAPKLTVELSMADGTSKTFRLVPAMAKQGVLVNPLLLKTQDLEVFLSGHRGNQVESIQFHRSSRYGFNDEIKLRIETVPMPSSGRNILDDTAT